MENKDFRSVLSDFLKNNPDIPEGEVVEEVPVSTSDNDFRMDVVLEKKGRAGKQATIICGFQGSDEELLELASVLKRKLATGGSARGGEILIQGDRRKEVVDLLKSMGYKARII